MKKLSLNLEALTVESFETNEAAEARGTVRGHVDTGNLCGGTGFECEPTFEGRTCHGEGGFTCEYHCTWWPGTTCIDPTNDVELC